jgi:hypothetical protein
MDVSGVGMTNCISNSIGCSQGSTNNSSDSSVLGLLRQMIRIVSELLDQGQNGQSGTDGADGTDGMGGAGDTGGMGDTNGGSGASGGAAPMTMQNAAGVLASYMGQHGINAEDVNSLYNLANNADGATPSTVQQAAQTMLANPGAYQQIETHDVAGADGLSGVGNFQWAAQGGLGAAGNATGGTGGTGGTGALPDGSDGTDGSTGYSAGGSAAGATTPSAPNCTGDLVADGKGLQMADEGNAMANFNEKDPARFESFVQSLSHGDGNAAAHTLADAVTSGTLSKGDAAAIGAQLQQTANAHGGGKINSDASNALSQALDGINVLAPGKTRPQIAFENLFGVNLSTMFGVSTQ